MPGLCITGGTQHRVSPASRECKKHTSAGAVLPNDCFSPIEAVGGAPEFVAADVGESPPRPAGASPERPRETRVVMLTSEPIDRPREMAMPREARAASVSGESGDGDGDGREAARRTLEIHDLAMRTLEVIDVHDADSRDSDPKTPRSPRSAPTRGWGHGTRAHGQLP